MYKTLREQGVVLSENVINAMLHTLIKEKRKDLRKVTFDQWIKYKQLKAIIHILLYVLKIRKVSFRGVYSVS